MTIGKKYKLNVIVYKHTRKTPLKRVTITEKNYAS